MKLNLCKVWNVQVHDAYFDNQLSPNIKPIFWNLEQIRKFRKETREHNQMVNFRIYPELKDTIHVKKEQTILTLN